MCARTVSWWVIGVLGCGGASQPAEGWEQTHEAPAASVGDEVTPEPAPAAVRVPTQDTGPARLIVRARVGDRDVAARVRVLAADGGRVRAEAQSGEELQLPSGQQRIEVQVSDAAVLADTPTQQRDVLLAPGKLTPLDAEFPWAKVQLNVLINGHAQSGVSVKVLRNEQVVAELKSGASPVAISPGRYEADVQLKGTTIRVKGLLFSEHATQVVPVRVQR